MTLVSGKVSSLNPNAPLFVPAALRQVEDFSPEWWQLVTTSTWFHDYWMDQHQGEDGFYDNGENDALSFDVADLLPEAFEFDAGEDYFHTGTEFDEQIHSQACLSPPYTAGLQKEAETLSFLASLEERSPRSSSTEPAKYNEKPAKWANPRCSPRNIHQPR